MLTIFKNIVLIAMLSLLILSIINTYKSKTLAEIKPELNRVDLVDKQEIEAKNFSGCHLQ